jgi:single-stranded-DNA-specific exonuclease
VRFGGHQQAAGLEVLQHQLGAFREQFIDAIARQGSARPTETGADLLQLEAGDELRAVLADMDRLEPCGFGNPRPRLVVEGRVFSAREVKNGHLKLVLDLQDERRLDCFAIQQGPLAATLSGRVRVTGDLRHNNFNGAEAAEMFVDQVVPLELPAASGVVAVAGPNVPDATAAV